MTSRPASTGESDSDVWHSRHETATITSSSSLYGSLADRSTEENKQRKSVTDDGNETRRERPRHTNIFIYCSHFLSAWGDRMWSFGVGLFLVRIAGNSLQLPAIYGLTSGLSICALGALVGDWVDSTPRLKAAQIALVSQNLLVAACAGGVFAYIHWEAWLQGQPGDWTVPLCQGVVILLAVLADLTSMARVLAVEKDWIVQICGEDRDMLARMTAILRRIDQTTLIVAPAATGQVMTYAGLQVGALFIGGWNLLSVTGEYYLMWKVYTTVPALASRQSGIGNEEETPLIKDKTKKPPTSNIPPAESETTLSNSDHHHQPPSHLTPTPSTSTTSLHNAQKEEEADDIVIKTTPQWNESIKGSRTDLVGTVVADTEILLEESEDFRQTGNHQAGSKGCCGRAMGRFRALYQGWLLYKKYTVSLAGLALSFLYMTVLGFDNITVAYSVTQGVSESILGIMMAVSAVFGMVGTFVYPIWRRRVGLVRTGILALSCQVCCLSLCVVSIWMPGSPFDPTYSHVSAAAAASSDATESVVSFNGTTWTSSVQTTSWPTPTEISSLATQSEAMSQFPTSGTLRASLSTSPQPSWLTSNTSSAPQEPPFPTTENTPLNTSSTSFNASSNINIFMTASTIHTDNSNVSRSSERISEGRSSQTLEANLQAKTLSATKALLVVTSSQLDAGGTMTSTDEERSTSSAALMTTGSSAEDSSTQPQSYVSVILFITGIVLARFGLWTADLAITQQFLEAVREGERGTVNGVQSSLNQFFDVLKFLLVILIPDTETFGLLILLSFAFVCAAWVLYALFLKRARGHFFHRWNCFGGPGEYARL